MYVDGAVRVRLSCGRATTNSRPAGSNFPASTVGRRATAHFAVCTGAVSTIEADAISSSEMAGLHITSYLDILWGCIIFYGAVYNYKLTKEGFIPPELWRHASRTCDCAGLAASEVERLSLPLLASARLSACTRLSTARYISPPSSLSMALLNLCKVADLPPKPLSLCILLCNMNIT